MAEISIIIPAYNAAAFVGAAVASALAQGNRLSEVVVVDDGSMDETAAVATAAGARVLRQENGGIGAARNSGVAATAGTLVPLSLKALKVDPALGSAVFITTFTDMVGFAAFLGLATVFLRYLVR